MRTSILGIAMVCLGAASLLRGGADHTATACLQNALYWNGKQTTVDVIYFDPAIESVSLSRTTVAQACTWDSEALAFGGFLPVLWMKQEGEAALRKYGVTDDFKGVVNARPLTGVLKVVDRPSGVRLVYLDCTGLSLGATELEGEIYPLLETIPLETATVAASAPAATTTTTTTNIYVERTVYVDDYWPNMWIGGTIWWPRGVICIGYPYPRPVYPWYRPCPPWRPAHYGPRPPHSPVMPPHRPGPMIAHKPGPRPAITVPTRPVAPLPRPSTVAVAPRPTVATPTRPAPASPALRPGTAWTAPRPIARTSTQRQPAYRPPEATARPTPVSVVANTRPNRTEAAQKSSTPRAVPQGNYRTSPAMRPNNSPPTPTSMRYTNTNNTRATNPTQTRAAPTQTRASVYDGQDRARATPAAAPATIQNSTTRPTGAPTYQRAQTQTGRSQGYSIGARSDGGGSRGVPRR